MPVLEDIEEGTDELQGCCGQLLATNRECKHMLCDGPHPGCGAWFYASPTQNLQDSVHHGVLAFICGACRSIYVSEGALVHHIIHGHNGPVGFKRDMNIRHGERHCTKVSYTY